MVLPGRIVRPACVALTLPAKLTLGIACLLRPARCRDGLGVLLRLAQVDGDVQLPVLCSRLPLHVLLHPVAADVVRVPTEVIVEVRGLLRALGIGCLEVPHHLGGTRRECAHELRVEQVPKDHAVALCEALLHCIIG